MKINCSYTEMRDVVNLVPHPHNANKHSTRQIEMLAKIMNFQGWRHPIIVSKRSGFIVAGHGRLASAQLLGWQQAPIDLQDFQDEATELSFLLSDNFIAELAETDQDKLHEIGELLGSDFDHELLGLEDELLIPDADKDAIEDDVPEVTQSISKLGDVYELGEHRLLCGDSTDKKTVEKLMNGEKADMVFTSPPYNGNTRFNPGKGGSGFGGGKNLGPLYENDSDNKSSQEYIEFTQAVLSNCFSVLNGFLFWNVNYNSNSRYEFIKQIVPYLGQLVETICWKKTALPVPHGLTRVWEPIFVFSSFDKKDRIGHPNKTEFNFWEISNAGALEKSHRAAYPVALPEKGIELCDPQIIFDPFGGSGSTLIACEKTKRKCFMMELDPHYTDVIVSRWCKYTGKYTIKRNGEDMEWLKPTS